MDIPGPPREDKPSMIDEYNSNNFAGNVAPLALGMPHPYASLAHNDSLGQVHRGSSFNRVSPLLDPHHLAPEYRYASTVGVATAVATKVERQIRQRPKKCDEEHEEGEIVEVVRNTRHQQKDYSRPITHVRKNSSSVRAYSTGNQKASGVQRGPGRVANVNQSGASMSKLKMITASIKRSKTHSALWACMYEESKYLNHIHLGALVVQVGISYVF